MWETAAFATLARLRAARAAIATAALMGALAIAAPARAGPCLPEPPQVLAFSYSTQSAAEQQDDFEDGLLERHWALKYIESHSYAYSTNILKQGKQALFLTVHRGDKQAEGAAEDRCSERAELREPDYAIPSIGPDLWYGFALYLPQDMPPIDRRLVLAQIKQPSAGVVPPSDPTASPGYRSGNPVIALRMREIKNTAGRALLCFSLTPGNDGQTHKQHVAIVQIARDDAVGRWHNIVLHAKIVPGNAVKSRAEWWFDDQAVPRLENVPQYIAVGYAQANPTSYFKMGPYRDQAHPEEGEIEADWSFGFDEYKRHLGGDDSAAMVAPTPIADALPLGDTTECKKALLKVE